MPAVSWLCGVRNGCGPHGAPHRPMVAAAPWPMSAKGRRWRRARLPQAASGLGAGAGQWQAHSSCQVHEAHGKVRHTQALHPWCRGLDQGLGPVTDQVADTSSKRLALRIYQRFPRGIGPILGHLFQRRCPVGRSMQTSIMRSKNVSSTAPMISCTSALVQPSPGCRGLQQRGLQRLQHTA
jgi:hypothetical protein